MGAGRKTQTFMVDSTAPTTQHPGTPSARARNLRKNQLGGVIFGCKNLTINECLSKQIFGLPAQYFSFVKNIEPGLPLFLFNYSDRKLHGIFEAASPGQMNINPYGWTQDGTEKTFYPAQVQIRVRKQCQYLAEGQFKPIIADNYYTPHHFWFELDHNQTNRLISKLSLLALAPSTYAPQNTVKRRTLFRPSPSLDKVLVNEGLKPPDSGALLSSSDQSSFHSGSSDIAPEMNGDNNSWEDPSEKLNGDNNSWEDPSEKLNGDNNSWEDSSEKLNDDNNSWEDPSEKQVLVEDEDLIYLKLKELALNSQPFDSSSMVCGDETTAMNDLNKDAKCTLEKQIITDKKSEESLSSSDAQSVIARLVREIEELKDFKAAQIRNTGYLEKRLDVAEEEIRLLKDHCMILESSSNPLIAPVDDNKVIESFDKLRFECHEFMYLVGGYDGESWLSALDSYCPSYDAIKNLQPMSSVRSFASTAKLNGELYIFGGGNGESWYDTVESYNPDKNTWTPRPSLKEKKGCLAGVTVDDKIFAIGGGNGAECFADVEMFDSDLGRWISTRSMLQKRFALAAAELNGVMYATGGYDGKYYLKSAERFDPREHSWTRIESMNTKRGCHSLVALNEKLYALGGFDGETMIPSVEVYDPRIGLWFMGEPMNQCRGYSAAVVIKNTMYVTGGLQLDDSIVDMVESYIEGQGWQVTNLKAIGKRCYISAIVL